MDEPLAPQAKKGSRDPLIAGVLSAVMLGLGQAYNAQRGKGYWFFASPFLLAPLWLGVLRIFNLPVPQTDEARLASPATLVVAVVGFAIWLFGIFDAFCGAKRVNAGEVSATTSPGKSAIIFLVRAWLGVILIPIALLLSALVFGLLLRVLTR